MRKCLVFGANFALPYLYAKESNITRIEISYDHMKACYCFPSVLMQNNVYVCVFGHSLIINGRYFVILLVVDGRNMK